MTTPSTLTWALLPSVGSAALALLPCVGCAPWGGDDDDLTADDDDLVGVDDDDATGDDDDTADDDDTTDDPGAPIYADDEAWFALAPGDAWRYAETVAAVPFPLEDDVFVTVIRRRSATDLFDGFPANVAALEVEVDRLQGSDEVHWLGLNGDGELLWLGSERRTGFETEQFPGDGAVILRRATTVDDLAGVEFAAAWFLTDEGGTDVETVATGEAPFLYPGSPKAGVDCLETQIERNGSPIGLQYFQPGWGLLGMSLDLSGEGTTWEIAACGPCPPEAGLPTP